MDIHASPAPLPELDECLATFQGRFRRSEGEAALERYLTGLLTELPNKNCDTMAEAVPGTSAQRLQEWLTNMQWDEQDLNRQRVETMIAEATVGQGVLIFDDTGFAKQGKASVGGRGSMRGPGEGGQLPGGCDVLRQRSASELAGSRALVATPGWDKGARALSESPGAR